MITAKEVISTLSFNERLYLKIGSIARKYLDTKLIVFLEESSIDLDCLDISYIPKEELHINRSIFLIEIDIGLCKNLSFTFSKFMRLKNQVPSIKDGNIKSINSRGIISFNYILTENQIKEIELELKNDKS